MSKGGTFPRIGRKRNARRCLSAVKRRDEDAVRKPETAKVSPEWWQIYSGLLRLVCMARNGWSGGRRHTFKKIDYSGFQRIFGAHDQDLFSLDHLFQEFRSVPQVVGGSAHVGPHGMS